MRFLKKNQSAYLQRMETQIRKNDHPGVNVPPIVYIL